MSKTKNWKELKLKFCWICCYSLLPSRYCTRREAIVPTKTTFVCFAIQFWQFVIQTQTQTHANVLIQRYRKKVKWRDDERKRRGYTQMSSEFATITTCPRTLTRVDSHSISHYCTFAYIETHAVHTLQLRNTILWIASFSFFLHFNLICSMKWAHTR